VLVVVPDRPGPIAQPFVERLDERLAVQGMAAQLLPLVVGGLAGLVQDLRADVELADVMEERGPVEAVELLGRQAELLAEAVRVGADPLGVTTRDLVVDVELAGQLKQDLRGLLRTRRLVRLAQEAQPLLEALDGARAQGQPEPRRGLVREHQ
jgi:hypothetical protein